MNSCHSAANVAKVAALSIAALTVAACGLRTYTSGVMPMGPDTYTVSADDLNASNAKKAAMRQASQFCSKSNKQILVINTKTSTDVRTLYDINFRCLGAGDPELTRPNYEKAPDVLIKTNR